MTSSTSPPLDPLSFAVLEGVDGAAVLLRRNGQIAAGNQRAREELGDDIMEKAFGDVVSVASHDRSGNADLLAALRNNTPMTCAAAPTAGKDALMTWSVRPIPSDTGEDDAVCALAVGTPLGSAPLERIPENDREHWYRVILDNAPFPVMIKDADGRYLHVNTAYEQVFNVRNSDMMGKMPGDVHNPDVAKVIHERDMAALTQHTVTQGEAPVAIDGSIHTFVNYRFPMRNMNGDILGLGSISTDITERVRAEQAVRDARDELEQRVAERTTELAEKTKFLELLIGFETAAAKAGSINAMLPRCVADICEFVSYSLGHVYTLAEFDGVPTLVSLPIWHTNGADTFEAFRETTKHTRLDVGVGLPGLVLDARAPVYRVLDDSSDNSPRRHAANASGLKASFGIPVIVEGRVTHVLEFFSCDDVALTPTQREAIGQLTREIGEFAERIHLREKLHDSERYHRSLIERSPDGIILQRNGTITDINPQMLKMLGADSASDYIGRPVSDLFSPAYQDKLRDRMAELREPGSILPVTGFELLRTDGSSLPVDAVSSASGSGADLQIQAVFRDVTKRKEMETGLRKQLDRMRMMAEIMSTGDQSTAERHAAALEAGSSLFSLGLGIISRIEGNRYTVLSHYAPPDTLEDGQIFETGDTYCDLTLKSGDVLAIDHMGVSEYSGHPCYAAFGLESYIGAPYYVNGAVRGTVNFSAPTPPQAPFDDADKDFVRLLARWVGMTIAQEEATQAIRLKDERLNGILSNAAAAIMLTDLEGQYLEFNDAWSAMTGFPRTELQNITNVELTHPDDVAISTHHFTALCAGDSDGYRIEKRYVRKDGGVIWGDLTVAPLRDQDGELIGSIGTVIDITERKKVDQLKSEFISTVSHELRTPLTSIVGSLGLLNKGIAGPLPEKATKVLSLAERNANRLVALVNDILDFEKLESDGMDFVFDSVDLNQLLAQSIAMNDAYAQQFGVTFRYTPPTAAVRVRADATRIQQVVANLLSNAAKFSEHGEFVDVGLTVSGADAEVFVRDYGKGIPKSFHPTIFHRFSQAESDTTRKAGGTGLGLSISKAIVDAHQGHIRFDTETGKGTTFYFTLPMEQPV